MKKEEIDITLRVIDKIEENLKELREEIIHKKYMNHNKLYDRGHIAIVQNLPRNSGKPLLEWSPDDHNLTGEEMDIALEKGELDPHTYVVTPYFMELSWLFFRLKDIFYEYDMVNMYNDYDFFGSLSHIADNYTNSTRSNNIDYLEKLLLSVHEGAYSWIRVARKALPIDMDQYNS